MNFVPNTVSVNDGPPASADVGEVEVNVGTGLPDGGRGGGVEPPPPQPANPKTNASARTQTATFASEAMRSRRVPSWRFMAKFCAGCCLLFPRLVVSCSSYPA